MTGGSEARWWLSLLTGTFGSDGTLIMPREEPTPELRDFMRAWGPDTAPDWGDQWAARWDGEDAPVRPAEPAPTLSRAWPPCQCGGPKCRPDEEIPDVPGPDGGWESGS
ncbi:hypothetical protein ACFY7Z_04145 [Streptomyces sp. NPDC012623]|uniref:hypothetical protein n=1 Tax=unclassified Streptomyces TaxID=2593676 RepID=UPI0036A18ABD